MLEEKSVELLIDFIRQKTGLEKNVIRKVLEAEREYFMNSLE